MIVNERSSVGPRNRHPAGTMHFSSEVQRRRKACAARALCTMRGASVRIFAEEGR
ncbi:Hypothetical protein A7982_01284 [Minicystis rosea]|nr:Hypothetical protein A7982_01284 [Minicystis rosea]